MFIEQQHCKIHFRRQKKKQLVSKNLYLLVIMREMREDHKNFTEL